MLPLRDHLPTRSVPGVNYALIAIDIAAFAWEVVTFGSGTTPVQTIRGTRSLGTPAAGATSWPGPSRC